MVDAAVRAKVPDAMTMLAAAFTACGGATAYQSICRGGVRAGHRVLVVGLGPVGIVTMMWLQALGATAEGVDIDAARRAFARTMHVGEVLDRADFDGYDVTIDCSGSADGRVLAVRRVKILGTVVLVGLGSGLDVQVNEDLIYRQVALVASHVFGMPAMMEADAKAAELALPLDRVITETCALAQAPDAVRSFTSADGFARMRPQVEPAFASWVTQFLVASSKKRSARTTAALQQLARQAQGHVEALLERNVAFEHHTDGLAVVFKQEDNLAHYQHSRDCRDGHHPRHRGPRHVDVLGGAIVASSLIGIFVGAPVGGWASDKYGRKPLFMVDMALFVLGSAVQFVVDTPMQLFLARLVMGIAVGMAYSVGWPMLSEFVSRRSRGRILARNLVAFDAGFMIAFIVGYLLTEHSALDWRLILGSSTFLAVALFVCRVGLPESPRSLMGKGRIEEAQAVASRILEHPEDIDDIGQETHTEGTFATLFSGRHWRSTLFTSMFWLSAVTPASPSQPLPRRSSTATA